MRQRGNRAPEPVPPAQPGRPRWPRTTRAQHLASVALTSSSRPLSRAGSLHFPSTDTDFSPWQGETPGMWKGHTEHRLTATRPVPGGADGQRTDRSRADGTSAHARLPRGAEAWVHRAVAGTGRHRRRPGQPFRNGGLVCGRAARAQPDAEHAGHGGGRLRGLTDAGPEVLRPEPISTLRRPDEARSRHIHNARGTVPSNGDTKKE